MSTAVPVPPPSRPRLGGLTVLGVMVATRVLTAILWRLRGWEMGDTFYYLTKVTELPARGMAGTMTEYPVPVVWLLQVPTWAGTTYNAYMGAFAMLMIGFDLAFCAVLWARGGRHRGAAVIAWSVFLLASGPLLWLRFDLVPAVLVGAAAVFATLHPAVSGALLAVGAAVKLWPGSLIALFLHRRTRASALGAFLLACGGLLLAGLLSGGGQRLVTPLQWQSGRGLQIESVWATPLMLARMASPVAWEIQYSRWQAFEVFGPGVPLLLALASVSMVAGAVASVALVWRIIRSPRPDGPALAAAMLAVITLIIVTNKTLSPQYIAWLGAPTAALVARVGLTGPRRHSVDPADVRLWLGVVVAIALLSQLIYPWHYDAVVGYADDPPGRTLGTTLLALRNALLVWLTAHTSRAAWAAVRVRRTRAHPGSDRAQDTAPLSGASGKRDVSAPH